MNCSAVVLPAVVGLVLVSCSTTEGRGRVVTPADVESICAENSESTLLVEVHPVPHGDASAAGGSGNGPPSTAPSELPALVQTTADRTTLSLSAEAAQQIVPNDAVSRIVVFHRSQGAAVGAAVGVMGGIAAAVIAAATYSDPCAHSNSFGCVSTSRSGVSTIAGLVVGIPAALIGA